MNCTDIIRDFGLDPNNLADEPREALLSAMSALEDDAAVTARGYDLEEDDDDLEDAHWLISLWLHKEMEA